MPHESGGHASDDVLEQYSLGTLSGEELDEFEEHVLVCSLCQDRLGETDRFIKALRSAARHIDASPRPSRADPSWTAIRALLRPAPALILAAAVVLAIAGGWRAFTPAATEVASLTVALEAERGAPSGMAPAGRLLTLKLDVFGLPETPSYPVEIVDTSGNPVFNTAARRSKDQIAVTPERYFKRGTYWVRVYGNSRELLREYALRVSEDPAR